MLLPFAIALATVALLAGGRAEAAITYPWCAHYMMQNGPHNCGFVSFEQCRATVSGIGGTCNLNPAYEAPQARNTRRKPART